VLTIAQVYEVANAVGQRYQALVLLAMFSRRWGELAALRRYDIDLDARTVRVVRQLTEIRGGGQQFGPPKSRAGRRTVPIPELIIPVIRWHLAASPKMATKDWCSPARTAFRYSTAGSGNRVWVPALAAAGLAASAGAGLRELMDRMGHDSERAALICQSTAAMPASKPSPTPSTRWPATS
jgi:integrase